MNIPTKEELIDDMETVQRFADDSWRHGAYISEVKRRQSDGTFWRINYRLSTDGETDELREGLYKIAQVFPFQETVTNYR